MQGTRHYKKQNQSFPTARGQAKSQRARKLGRLDGARQQAPNTCRWARATARELNSHGRTSCCRQQATRTIRGRCNVRGCISRAVAPYQPSGPLKPTALHSDLSEPGVSKETTNRRTTSDMSGPLSGMPDGTNKKPKWLYACLAAGERPNKKPTFISCVSDTRSFLAWLQASFHSGLMAQIKGENIMVVPSTADGFSAAVSTLRSFDEKDGVSFHTFTLQTYCCARLLVKNLGRGMPERVIRERGPGIP